MEFVFSFFDERWVMGRPAGHTLREEKKTKEKTNGMEPGACGQRNLISLMGWLLFLWGGYGRQQAAKGSAKERERSKQPINESNEAERQKKVSEINHSSLN